MEITGLRTTVPIGGWLTMRHIETKIIWDNGPFRQFGSWFNI